MPVVVLTALAILGRVVTMPIPNFQPATALIVLVGLFFGKRAGVLSGMLVALISNFILGQGPWTLWQMFAWAAVGFGAGILGDIFANPVTHIIVVAYGVIASMLYGLFLDLQFFIAYAWETGWTGLFAAWSMGLIMNLTHAVSTLIFLLVTLVPWGTKLQRLKTKYAIRNL